MRKMIWLGALVLAGCANGAMNGDAGKKDDGKKWRILFDGKTLKNWEKTEFGGQGVVKVENGELFCDMGEELTGVTWKGPALPKMNYELSLEAKKIEGQDFFCGIGFPVGKNFCSFVAGGWGGSVVGVSSIDGMMASENESTSVMEFKNDRWYRIRLRVTTNRLESWIDKEKVFDVDVTGRQISIHPAMDLATPLGITTFQTRSKFRDIKIRKVVPPVKDPKKN